MAWLEKIVPSLGLLIGIVFVAVGSVMMLSSVLKIVTYNPESAIPAYYECPPNISKSIEQDQIQSDESVTVQDPEACREQYVQSERIRYMTNRKDNALDGGVFLFVGIIFWIIFARKIPSWRNKKSD